MRDKAAREIVAVRLRAARERAGFSIGQVTQLLGITEAAVRSDETVCRMSADLLSKYAALYGCSAEWLEGVAPHTLYATPLKISEYKRRCEAWDVYRLLRALESWDAPKPLERGDRWRAWSDPADGSIIVWVLWPVLCPYWVRRGETEAEWGWADTGDQTPSVWGALDAVVMGIRAHAEKAGVLA